jgi:hypothetical protein
MNELIVLKTLVEAQTEVIKSIANLLQEMSNTIKLITERLDDLENKVITKRW